jgi:hypothetical protein
LNQFWAGQLLDERLSSYKNRHVQSPADSEQLLAVFGTTDECESSSTGDSIHQQLPVEEYIAT